MRELKFRAWVNDHWVDWIPTCKTLGAYNASIIDTDGYTFDEDNPFIVEQYTGLKDQNGKEIYEGDILEFTKVKPEYEKDARRGTVVFYKDSFCVYDGVYIALGRVNNSQWHKCVVVGNIHEPPKDFRPEHLKRMGVSISKGGEE